MPSIPPVPPAVVLGLLVVLVVVVLLVVVVVVAVVVLVVLVDVFAVELVVELVLLVPLVPLDVVDVGPPEVPVVPPVPPELVRLLPSSRSTGKLSLTTVAQAGTEPMVSPASMIGISAAELRRSIIKQAFLFRSKLACHAALALHQSPGGGIPTQYERSRAVQAPMGGGVSHCM